MTPAPATGTRPDLPAVNTLVLVDCGECAESHHSRVQDHDDAIIWVSAPHAAGVPEGTGGFLLHWGSARGKHTLAASIQRASTGRVPLWALRTEGALTTSQARKYVRVDLTGDVELQPTERLAMAPITGNLDDLSEGGARCRVPAGLVHGGEGIRIVVELPETSVARMGEVIRAERFNSRLDEIVIEFDYNPALEDQLRPLIMGRLMERRRLQLG